MRIWLSALCVLLIPSALLAGTNDYWQVSFRACDENGNYTQFNCDCGARLNSSDGLDSSDVTAPSVNQQTAWISCFDLGTGHGTGYSEDWRAPVTTYSKTWILKMRAGAGWAKASVYLRVWNPSGAFDINGTIPISLKVASDPTGTYSPGSILIPAWDPDRNGYQTSPAYTFTFSNAAALIGGEAVELQLVAGNASAVECSIGEARCNYVGLTVLLSGVTASSGSADYPGLWVSSDGLPGLRVSAGPQVARGEIVDIEGVMVWADGVPTLTGAQVKGRHGTADPRSRVMSVGALANDQGETLDYSGINPVGLPCVTCGEVTARDPDSSVFYVDEGTNLTDGISPSSCKGIRIACGTDVSLPDLGTHVRVTGIRSVEKHVLSQDAVVNGEQRHAGDTLYVPVILVRDSDDILPLTP